MTFKEHLKRTNFKAFSNILLFTYSTDVCVQMLVRWKVFSFFLTLMKRVKGCRNASISEVQDSLNKIY